MNEVYSIYLCKFDYLRCVVFSNYAEIFLMAMSTLNVFTHFKLVSLDSKILYSTPKFVFLISPNHQNLPIIIANFLVFVVLNQPRARIASAAAPEVVIERKNSTYGNDERKTILKMASILINVLNNVTLFMEFYRFLIKS